MGALALLGVIATGCTSDDGGMGVGSTSGGAAVESSSSAGDASTSADASSTTEDPGQTSVVASSSETGDDTVDATSGVGFIYGSPDTDGEVVECSLFDQDCAEGERCAAWANDGGTMLNATRCVPVSDEAVGEGEPCVAEGALVTGLSDCGPGLGCVGDDPEGTEGTCLAYCNDDNPCEAATDTCVEVAMGLGHCEPS